MDNRTVTIDLTSKTATFTQRGQNKEDGFIRVKGKTITGFRLGNVFYPYSSGMNAQVPYEGDSLGW